MFPIGDENERGYGPAIVSLAFIGLNIFVFIFLQGAGAESVNAFTAGFSAVPREITTGTDLVGSTPIIIQGQQVDIPQAPGPEPIYLTLLTSMFLHGGWLHIAGNMLFLWVFGNNVEDRLGRLLFIVFYLLGGVAASALQLAFDPSSAVPSLGASGAVAAVLGAYLVMFPRARVVTLVIFFFITA